MQEENIFSGYKMQKVVTSVHKDDAAVLEHAWSFENLLQQDLEQIDLFTNLEEREKPAADARSPTTMPASREANF